MTVKIGDNNDNYLQGSQDGDWLQGKGGKDALDGLGGNDWLFGDEGEDVLFGGGGNDYVNGGADDDTLYGDDKYATSPTGIPGTTRSWVAPEMTIWRVNREMTCCAAAAVSI